MADSIAFQPAFAFELLDPEDRQAELFRVASNAFHKPSRAALDEREMMMNPALCRQKLSAMHLENSELRAQIAEMEQQHSRSQKVNPGNAEVVEELMRENLRLETQLRAASCSKDPAVGTPIVATTSSAWVPPVKEPPANLEAVGPKHHQFDELRRVNRTLTYSVSRYATEAEDLRKQIDVLRAENARLQSDNVRLQAENGKVQEDAAFLGKRFRCYELAYPDFAVETAVAQLDAAPPSMPASTGAVMQSAQAIGTQVSDAKSVFTPPPAVESKPNGGGVGVGGDPFGVQTDQQQFHDASQDMPPADPTPAPTAVPSGGAPYEERTCDDGVRTWLAEEWQKKPESFQIFARLKQDEAAIYSKEALLKVRQNKYTWELCTPHKLKNCAYAKFHLGEVLDEKQKDGVNCMDWIIEQSAKAKSLTGNEKLTREAFASRMVLIPGTFCQNKEVYKVPFADIESIKYRVVL